MSYTALYRKFRPGEFDDVKGQNHIVTTLKNQIQADRIGHAYLFCGTRGTGKTTIAKILAKAVNCENPQGGSPCNECSMCKAISNQTSMNVIEIDAASNNGVDNIREIIEEVQYSPTEGRYKVYIIDEVHMLSTGAFNALLKTLEEPPSYVIFILATTEVHKIPITILSRCQRYDFRRISIDTIADRLKELVDKEGVEAEEKAIRYIAKAADGSLRDGLSLLDQCIAFYLGQKLTYDKVLDVLGAVDIEIFSHLLKHVIDGEVVECIGLLEKVMIEGRDIAQLVSDFTWYMRNLLLVKTSEEAVEMVDLSSERLVILRQEATLIDGETLIRYIRIFSELSNQVKYASQKRVLVEIALIKLCKPAMETTYDSVLNRLKLIEEQLEKGVPTLVKSEEKPIQSEKPVVEMSPEKKAEVLRALPEDLKEVARHWNGIISMVSPSLRAMMTTVKPTAGEGNTLILVFYDDLEKNYIDKEEHIQEIEKAIANRINKGVSVKTRLVNQDNISKEDVVDLTKIIKMQVEYEE